MRVVTNEDIKNINKLYSELKTYAAVARATGFSPATVKKYVIPGYTVVDESKIVRYTREALPDFAPEAFRARDWGEMCELSDEEVSEIRNLWNEVDV